MRNRLEIGILRPAKHREKRLVQPEQGTTRIFIIGITSGLWVSDERFEQLTCSPETASRRASIISACNGYSLSTVRFASQQNSFRSLGNRALICWSSPVPQRVERGGMLHHSPTDEDRIRSTRFVLCRIPIESRSCGSVRSMISVSVVRVAVGSQLDWW
jgi:hypothetical protein